MLHLLYPHRGDISSPIHMTYTPKSSKERIEHRLKIAQGHLRKVLEMVETDEYCINIIHQSQAVQKALKEVDHLILEEHLRCCVADSIKSGSHDKAILEVMEVFKKS
ncbi:MAG: Copper-sensing transcriptional repressor CsoR [Microgenomates bacterium OLB23]|nr:MAG: Copper-sensing transcriptional repressor CsoR [Microgenomates bacterium OLB23]